MTEDEIERFREQLYALRESTQEALEAAKAGGATVELDQTRQGRLSRIDAMQGQEMALARERRCQELLTRVEGALRRLDTGGFGLCFICGDDIEPRRLEADPTVTRCTDCAA